ncbi:hypothetical protein CDD83_9338 [Cordyceps sp. RAO-2017]|nr:hypothetical protein CDD83_9338 [Cordyceps sp. RAO-2017]
MARGAKRKRKAQAAADERRPVPTPHLAPVRRDLLQLYYPRVQTLRDHVVCKLPATSRLRRKKIVELGVRPDCSEAEKKLAHALDGTLVCSSDCLPDHDAGIYQQFLSFSQRGDDSYVSLSDGLSASIEAQCEIVDFVIWLLFQRESGVAARPNNLLCDGFRKTAREGDAHAPTLPGISSLHPNSHAAALKRAPWPHLLALLGQSGQRLMVDLLVYSSVFVALEAGLGNYYQLTGRPLSALEPPESALARGRAPQRVARSLSDITLVRSRIFYAKPALSASGRVQSGYRHIRRPWQTPSEAAFAHTLQMS